MENSTFSSTVEESEEMLVSLPSLESPCLKYDQCSPVTCRSVGLDVKIKREKFKLCKLNSTPIIDKLSLCSRGKSLCIESEYKVLETLGVGTYGEVKLASCVSDQDKLVAVKIAKGQTSIQMLRNEAEILKNLSHECFPKFIDFKIDELYNKAYLIIEYFKGKTLDLYLEDMKLSEKESEGHMIKLIEAIKYLHTNKIAHRDLKPQNVIVTNDGQIKIIDFNISKRFITRSTEDDNSKFCQKFFTQICSPLFAAPEILSSDCYSESVDIWGLGVIYLSMLCGIKIFNQCEIKKLTEQELIHKIKDFFVEISDTTVNILLKLLSKNPEDRPTIEELQTSIN